MRRVLVVCALAGCGDGGPTGLATATVTHYDYTFDIESRAAHTVVTATLDESGNCVTLPFRAEHLDANTIKFDGQAAIAGSALDATSLTLCGSGRRAGDTVTLEADMDVPMKTLGGSQVGYSISQDSDGNSFYYLVSWVNGCDQFGPCDSRPDQFATYHFDVTHPEAMKVRCPGDIAEVSATETTCSFDHDGGPTYSTFGIAAYPAAAWPELDEGTWGGVHVTLSDRASTGIAAAVDPAYHDGYLTWLSTLLGPYPYGSELRVLTAPTYWSGFEHPGNIVLDDGLAKGTSSYAHPVQHVLDHEMTHMWAGDQTTIAGTYDFVWKESMAEYLSYVYEDMMDAAISEKTSGTWVDLSRASQFYPVPGEQPELFDYYGDVYGEGPMILFRQLEALTSRDQVLAAIASVLGHPHALSVDELVAALGDKTGLDLSAYTAAWIHGTGKPLWPHVTLTFTPGTGTSTLAVHQTLAPEKRCKFHVALQGANPTDVVEVAVDTFRDGTDQTLSVPTPAFAVTSTTLDPHHECIVFGSAIQGPEPAPAWRSRK
jgi:aminopeptidase N